MLRGEVGHGIGSLKTFTITPGTARESGVLATHLVLPTAEPATAQFSYTIQASDLPTISPKVPMKYNAAIYASGKIGAAASTITYNLFKNGVSVISATTASAAATQFWTHSHWRTFDVQVGDVIEVRYSAAQADVNLDFHGLIVYPSQPELYKRGTRLEGLSLTNVISTPNFTTATVLNGGGAYRIYPSTTTTTISDYQSGVQSFIVMGTNASYGFYRNANGDISSFTTQFVHATQRQVQKNWYPGTIIFREMPMR